MDRKLLEALGNLSFALQEISNALQKSSDSKSKSATTEALQSGKLDKRVRQIDKGIKQIQSDNKKILKNQETLISLAKNKSNDTIIGDTTNPKSKKNIKDGLSTILMISVGVLAIGVAFGIIGKVDFASVIALSIALPLVAIAFEKISQIKSINPKMLIITTLAISSAIVGSSMILQLIQPVGIFKLFTAVLIAAAFGAISFGLGTLLVGIKKANIDKSTALNLSWMLPLVFVGLSLAIAGSSWILQMVQPVGIFKLFTAVLIAAAFVVLSYALPKLMSSIKGITLKDVGIASLVMIAMTFAVVSASWILQLMKPIGLITMFRMILLSLTLAVSVGIMAVAVKVVNSLGTPKDYIKGGISILVMAFVIGASSLLLSIGDYKNYPSAKWSFGVGLSLAFFGLGAVLLGTQALNPFFYAGLGVILLVAGAVIATSYILSKGTYDKYPSIAWVGSSILILGSFASMGVLLGAIFPIVSIGMISTLAIAGTIVLIDKIFSSSEFKKYPNRDWVTSVISLIGGFSLLSVSLSVLSPLILIGSVALLSVSGTILLIDKIINKGTYKKSPSKDWISGVTNAILGFTELMGNTSFVSVIGDRVSGLFGGGIDDIANKILKIDKIFSSGSYKNYPTNNWMNSLSSNIKTYVGLAKSIMESDAGDVDMDDISKGMVALANGYDSLAKSIGKLGGELAKIDTDKLLAIKNLTGSIVLLSLMDSDQFESMMDALEDKAKIFVDVVNDIDKSTTQAGKGVKAAPSVNIKQPTTSGQPIKSMNDIYMIMQQVDSKLASISKSNDNLSKYVDEIRSSDIDIKKKK